MEKKLTGSETLLELLNRPEGLLALRGSDGDGEDGTSNDDSQENEDGTSNDSNNDESKNDEAKGKSTETVESLQRKLANSEEARDRNAAKRKELQTENDALKSKIAKMEKDGTPDDAIKKRNEDLEKEIAGIRSTNQQLGLQIAMRDDSHDWVDPDAALRLADLSEVEFDEKTGKPIGLRAALDKLAKDKPYLLKPAKGDDEEDESIDKRPRQTGKTPAPKRKNSSADAEARAQKLRNKYPGLRR